MSSIMFFRVLMWNLRAWLRGWQFLVAGALFGFMGWSSAIRAKALSPSINVWDAFFVSFAGPDAWSAAPLAMLPWLASHLLFFYLVGDLANGELSQRGYVVVPLIRSRLRWWWGKVVVLLVIAIGYDLWGLSTVLLGAWSQVPFAWQASDWLNAELRMAPPGRLGSETLLAVTLLLSCSTLFTMALLQLTLSVWWRGSIWGFATSAFIALLSWLSGIGHPQLVRWLPGSQSMLMRHTLFDPSVPNFSVEWSLLYNTLIILMTLSISFAYIRRIDIFGPSAMETR